MTSLFRVACRGRGGSLVLSSERLTFRADINGSVGAIDVQWTEIQEVKANSASSPSAKLRLTCVSNGGEDHEYFFVFTSRSELEKARAKINALAQGLQSCSKNHHDDSLTEHTCESTGIYDYSVVSGTTAAHDHNTGVFERPLSQSLQEANAAKNPSPSLLSRSHGSEPRRRASTGTLKEHPSMPKQMVEPEGVSSGMPHSRRRDSVPRRRASTGAVHQELPEEIHFSPSNNSTDSASEHILHSRSLLRSKSEQRSSSQTFHSRSQETLPRPRASAGTLDRQLQRHSRTNDVKSSEDSPTGKPSITKNTLLSPILQVYPNNSVTVGKMNYETEKYEPQLRMDFPALPPQQSFQVRPLPIIVPGTFTRVYSKAMDIEVGRNGPHAKTKEKPDIEACRISSDTRQDPKQDESTAHSDRWRIGCTVMSVCCCLVLCIAIFILAYFLVSKDDGNSADEARRDFYAYTYEDGAFWVRHR